MELSNVTTEKIQKFLGKLNTDVDVNDCVTIEDIDFSDAYNSICDMISDNRGFDIDIMSYSSAIQYLQENDASLTESLGIAHDMGYEVGNLNSEILASLLASQNAREDFNDLSSEIDTFFEDLQTELEDTQNED